MNIDIKSLIFHTIFAVVLMLAANSCTEQEPNWLRGNMHTHSFWSNGDEFSAKYCGNKKHGYSPKFIQLKPKRF